MFHHHLCYFTIAFLYYDKTFNLTSDNTKKYMNTQTHSWGLKIMQFPAPLIKIVKIFKHQYFVFLLFVFL